MAAQTFVDAGGKIGRSFSLGTYIPTAALLLWLAFVLFLSPSYGQPLSWSSSQLPDLTWLQAGLIGAGFLLLSLALHPLVFATTQFLEGYWGPSWLATWSASLASGRQRARLHRLERVMISHSEVIYREADAARGDEGATSVDPDTWTAGWLDDERTQKLQRRIVVRDAVGKARERYPESASRVLPTTLGNILRREEDRVGAQYGLDALTVSGHLAFLVPTNQSEYLDDSRQQLDTAVRLCAAGLVAFVATGAWLLPSGWSLLLAFAPFCFAFVSYKGAIAAAQEYMYAFSVILDLNRFSLYEAMHVPLPTDGRAEVRQNHQLMQLLGGVQTAIDYQHKPDGGEQGGS